MRSRFDEQLHELERQLTEMGGMIEDAISKTSKALVEGDVDMAKRVIAEGSLIDQKERVIESLCLKMLLQQQPVAKDLRQISAALKMITDMERIGDQAEDIAGIVCFLNGRKSEHMGVLENMAVETGKMVTGSIDAYVKYDTILAEKVIEHDDVVDEYFNKVKNILIKEIAANPNDGEFALELLVIAKYLERIGDHATNIAGWVIFSVTGVHEE